MFWMRCKFGKLMMWIKEMQKCDRCQRKRKKIRRKSIQRNLLRNIHAPNKALFSVLLMWRESVFFLVHSFVSFVRRCCTCYCQKMHYFLLQDTSRRFPCIDCLKSDKSVFRLYSLLYCYFGIFTQQTINLSFTTRHFYVFGTRVESRMRNETWNKRIKTMW